MALDVDDDVRGYHHYCVPISVLTHLSSQIILLSINLSLYLSLYLSLRFILVSLLSVAFSLSLCVCLSVQ